MLPREVIVLGSLKGNIFAGVDGNENAFVVALEMSPMQIKIEILLQEAQIQELKLQRAEVKLRL